MEIVRGNDCVVDINDNTRTCYPINNTCVLAEMEPKKTATTNGVSSRGGGKIPLVSGSSMGTNRKLTVYNHRGGRGGLLPMPIPKAQPYESENRFCCYM